MLGTQSPGGLGGIRTWDHEGIQFNSSSSGRGSIIQNLTIEDAVYGVTVYGSNPVIENLTVTNPEMLRLTPSTRPHRELTTCSLTVQAATASGGDWRYGPGLSVGSAPPIVNRAVFSDILTRAVNIWGGSGGLIQGITVDNCSGSTWAMAAGIGLKTASLCSRTSPLTSPIRAWSFATSMMAATRTPWSDTLTSAIRCKCGVYVDKNNHTNYTNYETADFTNLTISNRVVQMQTANIGYAAPRLTPRARRFDDTLIEDSTTVGVRLYFVDSSTTFRDLTVRNSVTQVKAPTSRVAVRSSFFALTLEGLEVSGSVGPVYTQPGRSYAARLGAPQQHQARAHR